MSPSDLIRRFEQAADRRADAREGLDAADDAFEEAKLALLPLFERSGRRAIRHAGKVYVGISGRPDGYVTDLFVLDTVHTQDLPDDGGVPEPEIHRAEDDGMPPAPQDNILIGETYDGAAGGSVSFRGNIWIDNSSPPAPTPKEGMLDGSAAAPAPCDFFVLAVPARVGRQYLLRLSSGGCPLVTHNSDVAMRWQTLDDLAAWLADQTSSARDRIEVEGFRAEPAPPFSFEADAPLTIEPEALARSGSKLGDDEDDDQAASGALPRRPRRPGPPCHSQEDVIYGGAEIRQMEPAD